jgi:hypothetical protein
MRCLDYCAVEAPCQGGKDSGLERTFCAFVSQGRRGAPSTSVAIRYGDHKSARKPRRGLPKW